jgi:hypothetical protein
MDQLYLKPFMKALALFVVLAITTPHTTKAQGLVFKNASLQHGTAGTPGAVYRFPKVNAGIDALVTITGRSSSKVRLINIDVDNTGWDKAFQPQVTYGNNTTPYGITDWWMEFEISFVKTGTDLPIVVSHVDLTAIDIDGDGKHINEWVSLYNLKSYTTEKKTLLDILNLWDLLSGITSLVGKKFNGPVTNFTNIDTSSTKVMASAEYENKSSFRMRTGATSKGSSSVADRMYSFWFKSFAYDTPVSAPLPITLSAFTAKKETGKVILNWATETEKNASHFVIERSLNGVDYTDAGMVFTDGQSNRHKEYRFTDELNQVNSSMLYYRLKMVDLDGTYKLSAVRIIRMADMKGGQVAILAYPNPVVNELRVTLPGSWQDQPLVLDIMNTNGQVVKHLVQERAGQTQTIYVSDLAPGMYVVRANNGSETAVKKIMVKGR